MPSTRLRALGAAALLAASPPAVATSPLAAPPGPGATALTISGGAALGAYEAGFLYYALAASQVNGGALRVKLSTGASAGSINSLLALVHAEGGLPLDPYRSLFAQVWLPLGYRDLFVPSQATALGAFSRAALLRQARPVEEAFRAGLPASLDVVLGVAVTRVTPRERPIAGGESTVPRTEEKFVLRIQGRGPGKWPRVTNYAEPDRAEEQALLPEDANGEVAFEHVASLLVASAAFPVAFAPERLAHCMVSTRGRERPWCPAAAAEAALFVDGGVFDNSPLRLAARIAAGGLREGPGGLVWRDAPTLADSSPPRDVDFAFLSADARTYPLPGGAGPRKADDSLPALLGEELASFVATARSKELDFLLSEYPHVAQGLLFPRRQYPAASEPLAAFFGFFEESFRRFDFTLGMYEARRQAIASRVDRLRPGADRLVLPEDAAGASEHRSSWRPLACMRAVLDGAGDPATLCAGDDLAAHRILLQVSLDRLWNDCLAYPDPEDLRTRFPSCGDVAEATSPPRVPGVRPPPGPVTRAPTSESDTAFVVRLLAGYGFDWKDMGYGRADAARALIWIRTDLQAAVRALAARQPDVGSRGSVRAAGAVLVDAVAYFPPRSATWVLFGRAAEVGGATSVVDTLWLRLTGSLKLQNLLTALSSNPEPIGLMPLAGLEVVPAAIGSAVVQPSFLARAGYLFDLTDSGCAGEAGRVLGACSRPELEVGAAAVFASIVRLQLAVEWYPPARGAPGLWSVVPSLGFQFGF